MLTLMHFWNSKQWFSLASGEPNWPCKYPNCYLVLGSQPTLLGKGGKCVQEQTSHLTYLHSVMHVFIAITSFCAIKGASPPKKRCPKYCVCFLSCLCPFSSGMFCIGLSFISRMDSCWFYLLVGMGRGGGKLTAGWRPGWWGGLRSTAQQPVLSEVRNTFWWVRK